MQLPRLLLASAALLGALFISGSASSVTRDGNALQATSFKLTEANKAAEVLLTVSPEAKEKIKDNLKFDPEELRKHVERALSAYAVLDAGRKGQLPVVEVIVTSVRVRSNFSAVMWGAMAGADNISGDIVIKDATGKTLDTFHVSASYALGGLAGGQDGARMGWMYEEFAKQAVQEITGVKKS